MHTSFFLIYSFDILKKVINVTLVFHERYKIIQENKEINWELLVLQSFFFFANILVSNREKILVYPRGEFILINQSEVFPRNVWDYLVILLKGLCSLEFKMKP